MFKQPGRQTGVMERIDKYRKWYVSAPSIARTFYQSSLKLLKKKELAKTTSSLRDFKIQEYVLVLLNIPSTCHKNNSTDNETNVKGNKCLKTFNDCARLLTHAFERQFLCCRLGKKEIGHGPL